MKREKTYDGQTASFLAVVATCMPKNLNGETMQGWIEKPKALQKFLGGLLPTKEAISHLITHSFTVSADEAKTVEELTVEGKYGWSNSNITSKNFPRPESGTKTEKDVVLFHFGKTMTSEQVISEMEQEGYRPVTIHELLALGITEPNLQREFPILALGSVCVLGGDRHVAFLCEDAGDRYLCLFWFGVDWSDYCRFGAVRK